MASLTVVHQNYVAFNPRGGNALVSRSQLYLHRKLVFFCTKQLDSALDGSLHEDRSSTPVDVIENVPNLPETRSPVVPVPAPPQCGSFDSVRLKAMLQVSGPGPSGSRPPHILYLLELGFDLAQIKFITHKFPDFAYYTLEGKIRPLIEFLLHLGVSKSDLPGILIENPRLCGMSLSENIIPTMAFLETLGVDKKKWPKLITRFPTLLNYSRRKIEETVEYFQALGVDVAVLLRHYPQVIGLSIEANLKPVAEFFLENGFSIEEVGTMICKHGALYSYSLKANLVPKWEFFTTMGYPRQDLVKFPQYFSYSLKDIKTRYNLMKTSEVKLPLSQLLSTNNNNFELLLKKRDERLQLDEFCN